MKTVNSIVEEFKPFPKSNSSSIAHPRPRIGKTKKDKARKERGE